MLTKVWKKRIEYSPDIKRLAISPYNWYANNKNSLFCLISHVVQYRPMHSLILAISVILLVFSGCTRPEDPKILAEQHIKEFLETIRKNDIKSAYLMTDPRLQSASTYEDFFETLDYFKLNQMESYTLGEMNINKGVATLEVQMLIPGFVIAPAEMRFVLSNNRWSCAYFLVNRKQYFINQGMREPTRPEMERLATQTFFDFQIACKSFNFEDWHKTAISRVWAHKTDPITLRERYKDFLKEQFQLANFRDARLNLVSSSGVRLDGSLFLKGEFLSRINVMFEMEFLFEDSVWKPIGLTFGL